MAKTMKAKRGERNSQRRNGKAWKLRACGSRHAPAASCKICDDK